MPINKFGLSDWKSDAIDNHSHHHHWSKLRNYVRDNALCRAGTEFDAETRKIHRVAQPEGDDDAANKLYVEQSVKILRDRQDEIEKNMQILKNGQDEIEKNVTSLQTNRQFMLKYLQENIQTFKDQLNLLEKKLTTIQNNIQAKTTTQNR